MRGRASLLITIIGVAVFAVACGRATQKQIDQALGITPTATLGPADFATSTARAAAQASARASAGSPGAGASPGAAAAAVGNVTQGKSSFQFNCAQCHRPNSPTGAPILSGPDSPVVNLTDAQIYDLVRNGTNHEPPGPIPSFTLNDQRIADIIAYLRSIAVEG
ncbi:MAG: Cytochrome oxidase, cbb3-type, subunit [Thermomicrobiales bacterium]|jgi:mono/diheme cytochrome c family protein|nr:Cytochrome oxidase, cbb3-type, subunit [Thermomicrobiales bacterium]